MWYFCLYEWQVKSQLLHWYAIFLVISGFWVLASSPLENITLNVASKKTWVSSWFLGWHSCSCSCFFGYWAAHFLYHNCACFSAGFWWRRHSSIRSTWITKILHILDNTVSKQVGKTTCILAYQFNSCTKQCCDVRALQFPFIHNIKDTSSSEPCLYGHINWSLAQA